VIPVSGDIRVTPGIWTRQILANPEKTKTKFVDIAPETLSFGEMLDIYGEVTGRQVGYVQCSIGDYEKIWGPGGKELADQLVFGEQFEQGWGSEGGVPMAELGIKPEEVPGFRKTIESLKDQL